VPWSFRDWPWDRILLPTWAASRLADGRWRSCPIDRVLPVSNRALAARMLDTGGCLVSEYAPEGPSTEVEKWRYIHRDRLQAGISSTGVLLVEAGRGSGAMHCVDTAIRLRLPLACLMRDDPAWLSSPSSEENRRLVADGLAVALRTAANGT
jgi:predicted Rossmann fold nucleotide-binding protein DprA/Smf involved in DNA uptake